MKRYSSPTVAVVGASGAVGRTMQAILAERDYPVGSIRLLASERSAGTVAGNNRQPGQVTG